MMDWANGVDASAGWIAVCAVVLILVLLTCTVVLVRAGFRDRRPTSDAERELQMRLVRGEIDLDEFLREQAALRR